MTSRFPLTLAATLAVTLASAATTWAGPLDGEPSPLPASLTPSQQVSFDQQLADKIANRLQQSGLLHDFTVDVLVRGNTVLLKGVVANQSQREEVLRLVQGTLGVSRVLPQIALAGEVSAVLAVDPPAELPAPVPVPNSGSPAPIPGGVPGVTSPEPVPVFQAPGPAAYNQLNPPRMPSYAWPTYAPYNNYSRCAQPTAYPYNAWPFIGPMHPYPKVPLGWRSVKLEWDDGHWWYGRVATKYGWWRLRFW